MCSPNIGGCNKKSFFLSKSLQLSKKNSIFASFLAYNAKLRGNNQIMNNIEDSKIGTIKQWTPSEQSLACILSESHYTPSEFVDALGSLSFTALLKKIKPGALPWIKALFKAKVYSHVPKLNRRFAKECGLGLFAKRSWEIQSVTFSYNSKTVDGIVGASYFLEQQGRKHSPPRKINLAPYASGFLRSLMDTIAKSYVCAAESAVGFGGY